MIEENGKSSRRRTRSRCVGECRGGRARVGLIDGRRSGQSVVSQMPQLLLMFGVLGGLKVDSNAVRRESWQFSELRWGMQRLVVAGGLLRWKKRR